MVPSFYIVAASKQAYVLKVWNPLREVWDGILTFEGPSMTKSWSW